MITNCICGCRVFCINNRCKTALCQQCGIVYEINDEGDITVLMLPEFHTVNEQETQTSLLDMMMD